MGISPEAWWYRTFHGGVLYDPDLRPIHVKSERPLFYMVRRGYTHPASLDLALFKQATEAGVEFVWNQRLDAPEANIVASGPRGVPMAVARGLTFPTDLEYKGSINLSKLDKDAAGLPLELKADTVIEFWLENRLMIEVVSPAMAQEYQHFLKNAQLSVMNDPESLRLMRATHIKEPA